MQHRRIVQRHLVAKPPNPPVRLAKPDTQLVFFGGNHVLTIAAHALQRRGAYHHVAGKGADLASGAIPLFVAQPVVDRSIGMSLAEPAAYGGGVRLGDRERRRRRQAIRLQARSRRPRTGRRRRSGMIVSRRAKPALRARAAVKGMLRSSSTTSAPSSRAACTDPSVELELT